MINSISSSRNKDPGLKSDKKLQAIDFHLPSFGAESPVQLL
jgi:hypothetical protein